MKAALKVLRDQGDFQELNIEFMEYETARGHDYLRDQCKYYSETPQSRPFICIFDRDMPSITKEVSGDKLYRDWGNNVFSFAIPIPHHRRDTPDICIELYYKDNDIQRKDQHGRRLFLSSEFDPVSGWNPKERVVTHDLQKVKESSRRISIFDDKVFRKDRNVALPKSDFASYVLDQDENFKDMDFSEFRGIFDVITKIIEQVSLGQ